MVLFHRPTSVSSELLPVDPKSLVNVKRKIGHHYNELRPGSSNESLTHSNLGSRLRKISGNISDNSSSSMREIRYFSAHEEKNIGEERLVFVTTEHKVNTNF